MVSCLCRKFGGRHGTICCFWSRAELLPVNPLRNPGANFALAPATFSRLWASQITLVCCAVRVLRSLAQPSRPFGPAGGANFEIAYATLFGPVRSLSVRRAAFFEIQGRRSCAEILTQRSCIESLRRGLAMETSHRDLLEIL